MRNNQPVTGKAYAFPPDQTLISVTDLKGRITYCNNNFVVVSGFSREELLGQAHNLVRHPDMPEEAFRDLWETIQNGEPWSALVKNRRKNGDHYWVRANATPVRSGDRIVGYLSVRTAPKDSEIEATERLYALMRQEAAAGRRVHRLERGQVVGGNWFGRLRRRFRLGAGGQLGLLILLPPLLTLLAMALGAPLWAGALAALASAALAIALAWRVNIRPLDGVLALANRLAAGDLAQLVEVTESGIMGRLQLALAQMAVSVRTVVRDVRHEVANLRGGSQEIAAGNSDLSARTESQASNLEQTAASMEQINGAIKQTTQLATQGAALANEASGVSRRSHEAVMTVADTMKNIARSSDRIGSIIQVIEGVAFQTNILALNAAVEAARAGDQGRGFAVVAAEVRALAQRTTAAAREVRELIEESLRHVEAGSQQTAAAQARMDQAMASVEKTAALLEEIRSASVEQEAGISQVNQAVNQLDSLTQQNAAMVEELAAAAKSMDDQVAMVHDSIRVFRLTDKDVTLAETDAVELRKKYQQHQPPQRAADDASVDFEQALTVHQQWRIKLRNAILRGIRVDADQIRGEECCELGQWLHGGGGRRWGHLPAFARLVADHRQFHLEGGKVADLINQGKREQAGPLLESGAPFIEAGKHVGLLIRELRDQMRAVPAAASPAAAGPRPAAAATSADEWETF